MAWCHRASFWHVVLYPLHFVISQAWIRSLPTRRWPPVTGRYRVSLEHSGHTNASSRCLSDDVAILLFALPDIQTLHVTRVGPKYLINDIYTHTHKKKCLLYHNEAEQYKRLPRVRACEQMVCWQFPKSYWVVNNLKFLGLAVPDGGPANEKARSLNLRTVRAIRHAAGGTILRRDAIIRYDTVYLTCSKKLIGSQLSLPHGMNKKLKWETRNKLVSMISPVRYHTSHYIVTVYKRKYSHRNKYKDADREADKQTEIQTETHKLSTSHNCVSLQPEEHLRMSRSN